MESIIKIVSRGANRSLVGKDLCRNEGFTDNCKNYSQAVFGTSVTIKMLPTWLRPVFGHLIALPTRKYLAACFKESKPVIEYRLRMNAKMREDPDFKWDVPVRMLVLFSIALLVCDTSNLTVPWEDSARRGWFLRRVLTRVN